MSERSSLVHIEGKQVAVLVGILTVVQIVVLGASSLVAGGRAKGVEEERTRQMEIQVRALKDVTDKQADNMSKLIFQVGNLATEVGTLADQTEKTRKSQERMNYDYNRRFPMYAVPRGDGG